MPNSSVGCKANCLEAGGSGTGIQERILRQETFAPEGHSIIAQHFRAGGPLIERTGVPEGQQNMRDSLYVTNG